MLNIFIVFNLIKTAYADDFLIIITKFINIISSASTYMSAFLNSSAFLPAYLGGKLKYYMILYDLILLHSINNISPLPS